jgi:raffinose/stachyose/melibiose transport system permease protein
MKARKAKHGWLLTLIFSVISVLYMYPIIHQLF